MDTVDELKKVLLEKEIELDRLRMEAERLRRGIITDMGKSRTSEGHGFLDRNGMILELCCDMHWDFYPDTKLTIFSRKYQNFTGWTQVVYENFKDVQKLVHPDDSDKFIESFSAVVQGKEKSFNYEFRYRCANGQYRWFNNRCFGLRGPNGKVIYVLGLINDITEFRRQEAILQEEKLKNSFLVKTATDYIWEYDLEIKVFSFSAELVEMLDRVCGESLHTFGPRLLEGLDAKLKSDIKIDKTIQLISSKTGQPIWLEAAYFILKDGKGKSYKLIGTMRNISEKKRLEEAVNYDQLTKIRSRRAAVVKLGEAYDSFAKTGCNYAVYFLDLDDFKVVNDTYGHAAGDVVLQKFADLLQISLNAVNGRAYRWGGEEFIAVCAFSNLGNIMERANDFRQALEKLRIFWECIEIKITVSIGVSCFMEGDSGYSDVLERADRAVYKVKSLGKNGVCFGGDELLAREEEAGTMEVKPL